MSENRSVESYPEDTKLMRRLIKAGAAMTFFGGVVMATDQAEIIQLGTLEARDLATFSTLFTIQTINHGLMLENIKRKHYGFNAPEVDD